MSKTKQELWWDTYNTVILALAKSQVLHVFGEDTGIDHVFLDRVATQTANTAHGKITKKDA